MTYKEFVKKYNGKYVDVDNYPEWKYQCFDLAQKYFTEVLGLPKSVLAGCGNVCNMVKEPKLSVLLKYFDEVKTPQQGDVAIWYGSHNHIAIYDHAKNYYFSQNPNPSKVMQITMTPVKYFRLKSKEQPKPTTKYFKKYTGKSVSIVDALVSIGEPYSFSYRSKIAKANNIKLYVGTAKQNTTMLNLLKQGKLIKP